MQSFLVNETNTRVRFLQPFGFFDFITLEKNALCVLSDSGTVQEECALSQVPSVTLREVTERRETLEKGCNILGGPDPALIGSCVDKVLSRRFPGKAPPGYSQDNVSEVVTNLVLGFHLF